MSRLFWKIFLWFWGAMIVIGLALYFVVLTSRPDPLPLSWRAGTATAMNAVGGSAATNWERNGANALLAVLTTGRQSSDTRFWFFDNKGKELSGQPLPLGVRPNGAAAPHWDHYSTAARPEADSVADHHPENYRKERILTAQLPRA